MAFLNKRIEASNSRNNSVESVISYRIGEVEVFRRHETTIKSRSLLDKYLTQEKPDITSENHFERIKYIIDNPRVKVVSFDLFDTLVLRPFWDPTDLFSYIEKKFNLKGFAKLRIEAERKAWTNKTTKEKEDVSFDEIYYYMPNDFKHVKSIEQRLEVDFTYSNPETKPVYDYAISKGKKVIIATDMYLPEATIREILLKNGYNSHNLCFLSNTFFKCKRTGSLFKLIQKKVDVDYKQILHIGDNKTSDVEIPKKLGILTYYYPKVSESLTKSHCFIKQYLKEISSLDEKLFLGAIALGYHRFKTQNKNNESYWADLGYLFGGMLSYGFLNWLDEVCRQKNITQLLFVARDGYSLNSLFKQVSDISSLYVYAPRAVSTCINQSFRIDIKQGDDLKRDREISIINKVASFYGIGITGNLSDLSFRKRFIQTNTCYFEDFCKLIKGNYQNYINSLPLVGDEIGVVDSITGSFSAQQLIQKSLPAKNVFGFYVHKLSKGNERCFEFCKEDRKIEFCHFVELLFSSPEKPIEIILNNSPQYQKNINSLEQFKIDIYPEIQKGMTEAFLFLNEFKPRISDKCWYNWFHSFYKKPSEVDKFYLAKCQNGIDEAHTRYEPIFSKWYIRSRKIKEYYLFGIKVYRKEKN